MQKKKKFTLDLLTRVWQELDYLLDVWCMTKGAHIKHLYAMFYELIQLLFHCIYFLLFYTAPTQK